MPFGEWIDYCEVFCYTICVKYQVGFIQLVQPRVITVSFALLQNGNFLFPADSFWHKASSPSGVLAFVNPQAFCRQNPKDGTFHYTKTIPRTFLIRCSVHTRCCWIIMRTGKEQPLDPLQVADLQVEPLGEHCAPQTQPRGIGRSAQ